MELTERYKKIYLALDEFYTTMKMLEKISNSEERDGKQATKLIMTTSDIENIFNEQPMFTTAQVAEMINKYMRTYHLTDKEGHADHIAETIGEFKEDILDKFLYQQLNKQ